MPIGGDEPGSSQAVLTAQERRIALSVGAGAANKAVARELAISIKTVEFHLGNIYRKLGIGTRAELAHLVGSGALGGAARSRAMRSLPRQPSTLFGREEALAAVIEKIESGPLVTLTGPGGVGKTCLALGAATAVADRFEDGVWMVSLGPLSDGRDIPNASAIALGLSTRMAAPSANDVAEALGRQQRLIVLDTCEHVLDDAAALARALVDSCPRVVLLVTSRERLNIADECVVFVQPVSVQPTTGPSPAAGLFIERARTVSGAFDPAGDELARVEELCRRLDGLPLAIELAAARRVGLGVGEILDRLDDRFELLARRRLGGEHDHSLHATIEWSYDLLTPAERAVFDSLGVFAGSFDAAAAFAVSDGAATLRDVENCVAALVEKSMVVVATEGDSRRYVLLDTLHEFASRQIRRRGEERALRRRHLEHFANVLRRLNEEVRGRDELRAHRAILTDWHNLRTAIHTACEVDDGPLACALISDVLWWAVTRMRAEVGEWAERVRRLPSAADLPARTVSTVAAAYFAHVRGDAAAAHELITIARAEERRFGELVEPWVPVIEMFFSVDQLTLTAETQRRAREHGSLVWEALGILQETVVRSDYVLLSKPSSPNLAEQLARITESVDVAERLGNPNCIAYGARNLGGALLQTQPERAQQLLEQALATAEPLGLELLVGQTRARLAVLHTSNGKPLEALRVMATALKSHLHAGAFSELNADLVVCARPFLDLGNDHLARRVLDAIGATDRGGGTLDAEQLGAALRRFLAAPGESANASGTQSDVVDTARQVIVAVELLGAT